MERELEELIRQNKVYKIKLMFYNQRMLELESENKKLKKKLKPNFLKRLLNYITRKN